METVINNVRGDPLEAKTCAFCNKKENISLFGIIKEKRYDGMLLIHFGICDEHLDKLNSILSGEFDIDKIKFNKYQEAFDTKGIRLR